MQSNYQLDNYTIEYIYYSEEQRAKETWTTFVHSFIHSLFIIAAKTRPNVIKPVFKNPEKMNKQANIVKPAGNPLTLDCEAVGAQPIKYSWYKNGVRLHKRRLDSKFVTDQAELKLVGLVSSDSANYTCRAENRYGYILTNMVLYVQG